MKKITSSVVLALALVASATVGAGTTAEAKSKAKVTVAKVNYVGKTLTVQKGKKVTLKANAKVKTVKSSKKAVAKVKKSGKNVVVTAKKAGTAKITISAKNKKKVWVKVKVASKKNFTKANDLTFNPTAVTVEAGKSAVVAASKSIAKVDSSDATVATVAFSGKNITVTGVKAGKATITVVNKATAKKKTFEVTVTAKAAVVTPDPTPVAPKTTVITPKADKTATVKVTVPAGAKGEDVAKLVAIATKSGDKKTITIGNTDVVVENVDGVIMANGEKLADKVAKTAQTKNVTVAYTAKVANAVAALELAQVVNAGTEYKYEVVVDDVKFANLKVAADKITLDVDGVTYDATVKAGVITVNADITGTNFYKALVAKDLVK